MVPSPAQKRAIWRSRGRETVRSRIHGSAGRFRRLPIPSRLPIREPEEFKREKSCRSKEQILWQPACGAGGFCRHNALFTVI